jgi:DnaK suppressor protein
MEASCAGTTGCTRSCRAPDAGGLTCLNPSGRRGFQNVRMDTYDSTMAPRFRAALLQRAIQLGEILDHETAGAHAEVHEVGDFKDVAAQEAIATIDEVQAAHASVELARIREALARMKEGSYGLCDDCGDPIDLRRLQAMPASACCASCQSVHERH